MTTRNLTVEEAKMLLEFELIDDAFRDIYSEYPDAPGHAALGRAIDRLHAWREVHNMQYPPFGGAA